MSRRRRNVGRPVCLPDRWVVYGRDQYGEPFVCPDSGDGRQSLAEAARVADRLNRKGGSVSVRHERWSEPAVAYREVK